MSIFCIGSQTGRSNNKAILIKVTDNSAATELRAHLVSCRVFDYYPVDQEAKRLMERCAKKSNYS